MVSTLYSLSLRTLTWTLLWPPASSEPTDSSDPPPHPSDHHPDGPVPRYFHSAEAWGNKILVFGGEGYSTLGEGENVDAVPLRTLSDLCVWDTDKNSWEFPEPTCAEGVEPPAPRYAHLGAVSSFLEPASSDFATVPSASREKSRLIIMGGQDIRNTCQSLSFGHTATL